MTTSLPKISFRKTLAASALICAVTSTSVFAHESCEVNLTAGIKINSQSIEFFEVNKNNDDKSTKSAVSLYKIVDDNQLIVGAETVSLTAEQKLLVKDYSSSIRNLVPQVKTLAIEGVDLALEGVDLAFTKLLGEGNDVGAELSQELLLVRQAVDSKLSIKNGITFGLNGNDSSVIVNDLMGEEFEQRIESAVEKAVMNSMGSLLVALGQEMLFSDGNTDTFETRMESFGDDIATEMESRAEKIEVKAEQLCLAVQKIDGLEAQLKISIAEVAHFDVLNAKVSLSVNDEEKKSNNNLM